MGGPEPGGSGPAPDAAALLRYGREAAAGGGAFKGRGSRRSRGAWWGGGAVPRGSRETGGREGRGRRGHGVAASPLRHRGLAEGRAPPLKEGKGRKTTK